MSSKLRSHARGLHPEGTSGLHKDLSRKNVIATATQDPVQSLTWTFMQLLVGGSGLRICGNHVRALEPNWAPVAWVSKSATSRPRVGSALGIWVGIAGTGHWHGIIDTPNSAVRFPIPG